MSFKYSTRTPEWPKRLLPDFRHLVDDMLRLHAHRTLDNNRTLLILHKTHPLTQRTMPTLTIKKFEMYSQKSCNNVS